MFLAGGKTSFTGAHPVGVADKSLLSLRLSTVRLFCGNLASLQRRHEGKVARLCHDENVWLLCDVYAVNLANNDFSIYLRHVFMKLNFYTISLHVSLSHYSVYRTS